MKKKLLFFVFPLGILSPIISMDQINKKQISCIQQCIVNQAKKTNHILQSYAGALEKTYLSEKDISNIIPSDIVNLYNIQRNSSRCLQKCYKKS